MPATCLLICPNEFWTLFLSTVRCAVWLCHGALCCYLCLVVAPLSWLCCMCVALCHGLELLSFVCVAGHVVVAHCVRVCPLCVWHYQCFKCRPTFLKCRPTFLKCRPTFHFQALTATTSPPSFDMAFWKMSADISGKIRNVGRHFGEMLAAISGKCRLTF